MTIKRSELGTMKFGNVVSGRLLPPVHPGQVLLSDFIEPLGLTRYRVAKAIGVPQRRIDEICSGKRAITADTALRLGRFFSVEPQLWMNLQAQYDLEVTARELAKTASLEIVPLKDAA
ncbi:MAG TPA: HigA family addiction module antitoxin [Usitatibacter sp.]|jgi:addiction module HigA family antidote|nr:HigA family addiction module antitoxin [Usitatibacter sp.]